MFLLTDHTKKRVPVFFDVFQDERSHFLEDQKRMWGNHCVEPRDRSSHRYKRVPIRNDLETKKEKRTSSSLACWLLYFTFFINHSNMLFFIFFSFFLGQKATICGKGKKSQSICVVKSASEPSEIGREILQGKYLRFKRRNDRFLPPHYIIKNYNIMSDK